MKIYKCTDCGAIFEAEEAGVLIDDPGDKVSLPEGAYEYMVCPKCGSDAIDEGEICRLCGKDLEEKAGFCKKCLGIILDRWGDFVEEFMNPGDDFIETEDALIEYLAEK